MTKIDVKVTIDPGAVAQLQKAAIKAMEMAMDSLQTEVNNAGVIPRDHGDLMASQSVTIIETSKGVIASLGYNTPYARRLYFNPQYNFRTDKNPNARGKWLEDWITLGRKDFLPHAFATFWKAQSGGLIK